MKIKSSITLVFLILVLNVLLAGSVSAKDDWLNVRSKNFNLIGNASDKDIRKVGAKLEQFRETFRLLFPASILSSPIPTNVVVFKMTGRTSLSSQNARTAKWTTLSPDISSRATM